MLTIFAILSGLLTVISIILGLKLIRAGKLLDSTVKEVNDLTAKVEKQSGQLDEARQKGAGVSSKLQDEIRKLTAEAKKKTSALKKELGNLQQKVNVQEALILDRKNSLEQKEKENLRLKEEIRESEVRIEKLTAQLEGQSAKIMDKGDEIRSYDAKLQKYQEKLDRFVNLELKNEELKEAIGSLRARLNSVSKAAEHNRLAWLVTQQQLEMAEDRVHMLLKGFPRPGHRMHDPDVLLAERLSDQAKSGESKV